MTEVNKDQVSLSHSENKLLQPMIKTVLCEYMNL